MASAIGKEYDLTQFTKLATDVGYTNTGDTLLSKSHICCIEHWADIRAAVYRVLVYDPHTVARQAVLSKCIRTAMESGDIDDSDWIYNDGELVAVLEKTGASMKSKIHKDFKAEPPALCLLCTIDSEVQQFLDSYSPKEIIELIETYLFERFKGSSIYGYMFLDKGTFGKELQFVDPDNGEQWSFGRTTRSIVLYGFARPRGSKRVDSVAIGGEFFTYSKYQQ